MKFRRSLFLTCSSSFALVCLATPHASAQTNGTWSGASGATWDSTATNWTGVSGTPWDSTNGSTANATFNGSNSASVSDTVFVNRIDKTNTAGNTAISSGNITLAGSTPTITNNSTSSLNISSVLTGSNGVTVSLLSGAGTAGGVTFGGNNTYSGTTTINGSNNGLTVTNNGALGTSSVLVNSNGILKVSTGALSNNITINGGAGNGAIQTFTSSTLSGLITVASNAIIGNRGAGSTLNLTGGIAASGQTLTLGGVGGSSTIISNNVVNLGSGGTFRASAQPVTVNIGGNTWGTTLLDWGGTINLGANNALATASILQMGASGGGETATVDLKGFNQSVAGLRSFTGTGSASASGTRTVTSTTAATLTIDNSSGTSYLYDGVISGNVSLTKSGSSTQTLSGSSNYSGATTVNAGTLTVGNAAALGNGSGQLTAAGGTLDLGGFNVVRSGTVTFSGGTVQNGTLTNNNTAYDAQSGTVTASLSGSAGLTKTTSGTLNLNNSNTYSGQTIITAGNLVLNAAGALGSGSVEVASGARLSVANAGPFSNNVTINGNAGTGNGAIQAFANTTLSGLITLASDAAIGNRAGSTLNLTGGIAASNRTLTFNSVGGSVTNISTNVVNLGSGGTLRASAAPLNVNIGGNTWGTTQVDWFGTINLGATNALATASILQLGSSGGGETATVDLNGFSQTIAGLRSFTGSGSTSASGTRAVTSTTAATLTIDNSSGTSYLYDGVISGNLSLTKSGSAAQTLSGNNTYTGTTTINAGTLTLSGNGTLGTSSISISGGTLDMGGKSLTNSFGSLTGGTLSNGTLTNGGSNYDLRSGTVSAVLAGTNGLNKTTSATVTLSGNNSYSGATTVSGNGSVLAISNANALGATSGNTTVGDRAELRLSGGISVGESITLNGFGAVRGSNAALTNTSGTNTVTGLITLGTVAGENWIRSDAGTLNITGGVSSPNRNLTLTGGGGLNVTTNAINLGTGSLVAFGQGDTSASIGVGNNTVGALTIYYGGKVRTDVANAFSSSTALNMGSTDNSTGSLDLNGNSQTFGSLSSDGTGSVVITSASAATLSVNQTTNNTYNGRITGAVGLIKSGASTLTLSGNNTYSGGTTVSEGTLAINDSVAGAVAVNSGATLQGSGSIGGALSVSGQLSPGNSIESIGASSVSFLNGSTYAYELNSSVLGGDLLYTTGALSIASTTTLSLTELASGTLAMNDKLTLISYGTWNGGLFSYNGSTLNNGDKFTLGSNEWLFKYDDTTGGNNFLSDQTGASGYITMTVIPEPNVAMVAGSLALMAMLRRRRD